MARVAIIMGSDSDLTIARDAIELLKDFGVSYDVRVISAHRSPHVLTEYVGKLNESGCSVIIAIAGHAAHLAGVVASLTTLPVIGLPVDSSPLKGLDALLSTVQMPRGVPVATVSIGTSGAANAAIMACQILALNDAELKQKLIEYKKNLADKVSAKNNNVRKTLGLE